MHLAKSNALLALYDVQEAAVRGAIQEGKARFVRGEGNAQSHVVFVGEAPGRDEDRQGRPFVGRAGQILNGWLETIGLRRDDVYITNIVKCHPMKNPATPEARGNDRPPTPAEIALCWPVLREELKIIDPKVVVTLGSPATRTVLQTKETITRLHGRFHEFPGAAATRVFPIYHPAALCHNPTLKPQVLDDLKLLKRLVSE